MRFIIIIIILSTSSLLLNILSIQHVCILHNNNASFQINVVQPLVFPASSRAAFIYCASRTNIKFYFCLGLRFTGLFNTEWRVDYLNFLTPQSGVLMFDTRNNDTKTSNTPGVVCHKFYLVFSYSTKSLIVWRPYVNFSENILESRVSR